MIRRDVEVRLGDIEPADALAAVEAHQRSLAWSGDDFLARHWIAATHRAVLLDGLLVGVAGWDEQDLTLLTLDPRARRHDREVMEAVLAESGLRSAYVGSWDGHHVATFGAFAAGIASHAYQFRLGDPDHLATPVDGLELRLGTDEDLDWLGSTGFQDDYAQFLGHGALSIATLDGREAGIGVHVKHPLEPSVVSIGMYVDPALRRRGVGRSILALVARRVLDAGGTPVAGCWWRNWASRTTLESAGLVCAGTVFRLTLDPDLFADA